MGAEGDSPPPPDRRDRRRRCTSDRKESRTSAALAIMTACLVGGCFPSFQGLSSGSGGGAVSLDSGDSGSGGGGKHDAGGGGVGEGGPPHGVLNCDSLGNIGEWKDITPPGLDLSCPESGLFPNVGTRAFVREPPNAGAL